MGLHGFSLASDIPCFSLSPSLVAQPFPEGSAGVMVAWHEGSSAMLRSDLACHMLSAENGGLCVLKDFWE